MTSKVVVGVSGGVDSSVAALQLLEAGYDVQAIFMKNWNEEDETGQCMWETDVEDALHVCEKLSIPLNTVDLSAAYWEKVFSGFLDEYRSGLTPNPDILCNQEIKFRAFKDHALELGADYIATGHYARIQNQGDNFNLLKGVDSSKDQSYFLCRLNQQQLETSLFPVGELQKHEVRSLAKKAGLATHNKKDSTGICFIGERSFRDFMSSYLPVTAGTIVTTDGNIIGEHMGVHFYTLGQRQGLGIGGVSGFDEQPWYVIAKNVDTNELIVGQGHDHPELFSDGLMTENMHWINGKPATLPYNCSAKTRYRQADQDCVITEITNETVHVQFNTAQRAVTPGQYVVFYEQENCLGGGVIREAYTRSH